MGMFDRINYTAPCPACGAELGPERWQSKEHACIMQTLEPWEVDNFYAVCAGCNTWISAAVDADVEHVVKRCDISLRAEGTLPRFLGDLPNEGDHLG